MQALRELNTEVTVNTSKATIPTLLLSALLVCQVAYVAYTSIDRRVRRSQAVEKAALAVALADSSPVYWLHAQGGDSVALASLMRGHRQVAFLAFSVHCQWCDSVATDWQKLIREDSKTKLVLLTSDSADAARRYITSKGWRADMIAIDTARASLLEQVMVARTPWITVVDSTARRISNMHGAGLIDLVPSLESVRRN